MGTQNVLGTNYPYPDVNDKPWGDEHIDWATAVSNATNTLQAQIDNIDDVEIPALQAQINLSGQANTASNQGSGVGLVLPKVGVDLPFKTIVAGTNIGLGVGVDTVTINATGTGDVNGPLGALDNQVAVFDGITGKLIKMSGVVIDASNNITAINNLTTVADANIGGNVAVTGNSNITGDETVSGNFDAQNPTTPTVNAFWDSVQRPNSGGTATARELGQGSQTSSSSSSGSPVTIGTSVTLTTTGKPVFVGLTGNTNSTPGSLINMNDGALGAQTSNWYILRGATVIYRTQWGAYFSQGSLPAGVIWTIDTPAAGTYAYTVQYESSGNTVNVTNVRLVALELG